MSIPVGKLTIEMAANVARLQKDMDAAKKTVGDAMSSITGYAKGAMAGLAALGVVMSVSAFKDYVKGAIDAADKLNDLSKSTSISVENLSGLNLAAKQSGTDLDGMAKAINKLSVNIGEDGAKFSALGITAKEPLEAFKQLSDVFVKIEDPQIRAAVAAQALGKTWSSAAPLLAEGSAGIQKIIDKGKDYSGVTKAMVEQSDKFNDTLANLTAISDGTKTRLAAGLLPVLLVLAQAFEDAKKNGGLMSSIIDGLVYVFTAVASAGVSVVGVIRQMWVEITSIAELAKSLTSLESFGSFDYLERRKSQLKAVQDETALLKRNIENAAQDQAEAARLAAENPEKLTEAQIKAREEAARLAKQFLDTGKAGADSYQKMIDGADKLVASIKFETDALTMSNVEKETAIALQKLLSLGIKEGTEDWKKYSEAVIFATIEKEQMQKLVEERKKIDDKAIADRLKAEEKYADEIKQINNQIGQSLTDALMEGGVNAKDFLIKMFKTMILRPMLQPIITGMVGGFMSAGMPGAAAAEDGSGGGAVGDTMGLMGMASGLKTAYTMVTGGFAALGATVTQFTAQAAGSIISGAAVGSATEAAGVALAQSAGAIGSAASVLAGVGAGLMVGNLISDGKGIGGGSSWATVGGGAAAGALIGSVVPIVGTALGAAIGGVVGGLANAAFGTGKKKIDDIGITVAFNSMGNTIKQYEDWSKKGGFLSGGSKGTDFKEVDSEMQKFFDNSVAAVAISVKQYSDILGLPARDITQYSLEIEKSLEGLSPEEAQKAINETIKAYADGLSGFAAAEIAPFQRSGEALSDTLARLGGSLKTVNDTFGILNIALYDSTVVGADAASKLADAFGGLDKFVAATDAYYQNFYSAQERADKTTESLSKVFNELGLQLPSTNAQFRAMVEAARAAGNDTLFANLIKLAPAFANLKNSLASLVDSAFQDLQAAIQREQKAAIDAIERQKKVAEAQRQVAQESVDSLTSVFGFLTAQINELSGATSAAQSAAEGRAFISNAVEAANNTGYLPDQQMLETAVSAVRAGMESTNYATAYQQKLAQMQLAAQLSDLQGVAEEQKTTAELQLEVAIKTIDDLNAQAAATNAYYEEQLIYAQTQINELRNVNGSVMTVAGAMSALGAAIEASKMQVAAASGGGGGGGSDTSRTGQINGLYQEILGRNAESGGLNAWNGSGLSIDQIREGIQNSPEARGFATGGYYPGGLAMVGEQGRELINFNRPGQVYTAGQTAEILGGGSLAAEIQGLRTDIQAQSRSNAQIQIRTAKVLERWESSGLPEVRVEV